MKKYAPIRSLFFLAMLSASLFGHAQSSSTSLPAPKVILVRLASGHSRIVDMKRRKDKKGIEEVQHDVAEVNKRMINDFTTNFHACPIYYFVDTNMDLVKDQKFDGILLNADMTPVPTPVMNSYYIVYYGHYTLQLRGNYIFPDTALTRTRATQGQGLVVLNEHIQQIDRFYKMGYDEMLYKVKKANRAYCYCSKHYDIEYFPFATMFDKALTTDYSNRRFEWEAH